MSDEAPPAMDYAEHERTYDGFIKFSKIATIGLCSLLWALVLFTFGGSYGPLFGSFILIAIVVAGIIGIFSSGDGSTPSAVVFGLATLLALFTTL